MRWLSALLALLVLSSAAIAAPAHKHKPARKAAPSSATSTAATKKAHAVRKKAVQPRSRKRVTARAHARKPVRHAVRRAPERLELQSQVVLVIDQETENVLLEKNASTVLPIASLTKLMTGVIIADAGLALGEKLTITPADVDRLKFSSSRLKVGTELTRGQALHLALMSSENRAAHALARTYPGGETAFVSAMNVKAKQLGMEHTRFAEPTGLSSLNRSTARDLAVLADAAYGHPLLRKYSTSPGYRLAVEGDSLRYVNTNRLVRAGEWKIGLQKTGFINEAGQCLVVQTRLLGRKVIMVFLNSRGTLARIRDAEQVRRWVRSHPELARAAARESQALSPQPAPES